MKAGRFVAILLSLALLVSLASCASNTTTTASATSKDTGTTATTASQSETAAGTPVPITFWTLSNRQQGLEPIVTEFNSSQAEVKLTVAYYDIDGFKNALKVGSSSGSLPDMWFNWGGSLGGFYAENGMTKDLTAYAQAHNWEKTITPGALSLCKLGGQLAGYPTSYNVLDVYYRKDIFQKYNIAIPTTFEEFETACATLKSNGITPISTAGLYGWHVMRFVELLVEHYAGAETHDKLNTFKESWKSDAVIKAMTKYQEFVKKGYFPDGFITADPNDTKVAVYSGKAAMDIQGQWYDGLITQDGQDINLYGTFAFPSGGTNRLSAFVEMMQYNKNLTDAQLDAAMKFSDFYFSDAMVAKYPTSFNLPLPRIGAKAPAEFINVPVMIETSSKNGAFTITDQAFPPEIANVLFDVQAALANDQMTPEQGAAAIQDGIEKYQNK